jgi:hypothetical protein
MNNSFSDNEKSVCKAMNEMKVNDGIKKTMYENVSAKIKTRRSVQVADDVKEEKK